MEVILTHEQADFDALASLLAAQLLSDQAIPILPGRLNHNVRNFINLYGVEFSFIEARDLDQGSVSRVTLVDTQSMVTLKGIHASTRVRVIDHHTPRENLPVEWEKQIEPVGATTTLLADMLRDANIAFTPLQATLLLLGIYEDTGSLSYTSTSVKDVRAAAFLLEKGASLRIAAEFLNPALSEKQKLLADRLLENVQTHEIHSKRVLISTAYGLDVNEEISSIAHKLRDLLDPDALFLLVVTSEGIRLVARSTSDHVNVALVAQHFGGGGHERASAALIQPDQRPVSQDTLDQVQGELLRILQEIIPPSITVGKIMSRKPHLLDPDTPAREALKLMQRYGYEGYPVVENGAVVGLLTRRAVDRAVTHKLNLSAGSLMEAGSYCLKSSDSIDQLQQLMAETGWGQIPVIDPTSNEIIGIVTRTDLLKTLPGMESASSPQKNYAQTLEKALSPTRLGLLKLVAEFSTREKQPIYVVGGFVRDLLLDRFSPDFDIVVEGDAIQFARTLAEAYGGRVTSHRRFGTAKWQIKEIHTKLIQGLGIEKPGTSDLPESLDLISARTEFYDRPSALPVVERSSIKLDLHRRDFTINTLALRLDGKHYGELYDYWGGLEDLGRKYIRVLHSLSFVDDPTRLLRAVRFEQRFAFQIEKRTLQLMGEARELLPSLGGERLRHEFILIFQEEEPIKIITRLGELNLLKEIHPGLRWEEKFEPILRNAMQAAQAHAWELPETIGGIDNRVVIGLLTWFALTGRENALPIARRLRLTNQLVSVLDQVVKTLEQKGPAEFTQTKPILSSSRENTHSWNLLAYLFERG